ncbi:MAG TPA: hypothetical protein VFB62_08870, partial [Polyangiaceae bacterium]|nr:hypothetical protein [Polyangiaceae bacterium]
MRLTAVSFVCAIGLSALGCHGSDDDEPLTEPSAGCAAGEWLREDGQCIAAGLPPDMPCLPGEWLRDDGLCIPAGVPPDGCGQGFVHDGDRGCDPILPEAPCLPGLMAVPGDTSCREVAPCAAGTWGDIPVEPDTEYVDASYAGMDSDGSALKPWTRIQDAVDAAASGAVVAIAEGSYLEDVTVSGNPVRLWGVCPALVEVVGTGAAIAAVSILAGASGTEVRELAVRGDATGIHVFGSLDVRLERVWVHDTAHRGVSIERDFEPTSVSLLASLVEHSQQLGVYVGGAEATVEASAVRDTQPDAQGFAGRGVGVQTDSVTGERGTLLLRTSLVERSHELGMYVSGGEATVEACVVRDTQPDVLGLGVHAQSVSENPAELLLRTSLVEHNYIAGVSVTGSNVTVEATVVRGTQPDAQGNFGRGVNVVPDLEIGVSGALVLRTSLVEQNHGAGVSVENAEATVEASVVRDGQADAQTAGRGVNVQAATLLLRTSLVERNQELGLFVLGSDATVESSIFRDTQAHTLGIARGVGVQDDPVTGARSKLHFVTSLIEQCPEIGLFVEASDATVETSIVRDVLYRGIVAQVDGDTNVGATLELRGSLVERSREFGVSITGSVASVESCAVVDTAPSADLYGDGVVVWSQLVPASATITKTRIEQSTRAAVSAYGAHLAIGGSTLRCQAFDLDYERYHEIASTLEDLGGNSCG